MIVRIGEYDTQVPSESEQLPHQDRYVSEISIHPSFRAAVAHYDLALIALEEPFQLAQNAAPICVPFLNTTYDNTDVYDRNRCIATGWGQDAYGEKCYQFGKIDVNIAFTLNAGALIFVYQIIFVGTSDSNWKTMKYAGKLTKLFGDCPND